MIITTEFLKELKACQEGIDLVANYENKNHIAVIERLIADNKLDWANWLLPRTMTYKQYVSYAVFAAEQVIDIFEKKYPKDERPRKAIEAAKKCIDDPSEKNKDAAVDAAYAAYAADAAARAAYAAGRAADAAGRAADAAGRAAYAAYAAYAADAAAHAAYAAARAADAAMLKKILDYGIKLLKAEYKK